VESKGGTEAFSARCEVIGHFFALRADVGSRIFCWWPTSPSHGSSHGPTGSEVSRSLKKTRANVCSRYDGSLDDPSWAVKLSKSPCYSLSRIISRQRWYPWETGPNPVLENINMLIIRPSISLGVRVCIQVNESELITQQGGRRAGEEKAQVPQ